MMVAREIRISKQANVNMAESTAATYATETNAAPDASKTICMLMTLCDCQTMFNITIFTDALEITRQAVIRAFQNPGFKVSPFVRLFANELAWFVVYGI